MNKILAPLPFQAPKAEQDAGAAERLPRCLFLKRKSLLEEHQNLRATSQASEGLAFYGCYARNNRRGVATVTGGRFVLR